MGSTPASTTVPAPPLSQTDLGKSLKAYVFSALSLYLAQLVTYLTSSSGTDHANVLLANVLGVHWAFLAPLVVSVAAIVVNFVYHRYFNKATPSFTQALGN